MFYLRVGGAYWPQCGCSRASVYDWNQVEGDRISCPRSMPHSSDVSSSPEVLVHIATVFAKWRLRCLSIGCVR
jgi:hypothetical protein